MDAKTQTLGSDSSLSKSGRPRPPIFRALGSNDPPAEVVIGGVVHRRVEIFKHDSWAATALYEGPAGRVVCKFNRRQRVGWLPMRWLGRALARREKRCLRRMAGVPGVPRLAGRVFVRGRRLPNVVAREYVPGHPLGDGEHVGDHFFPALRVLLDEMHHRDMAYVDLHKHENILVGSDDQPYLFDFQISLCLPRRWPGRSVLARVFLRVFQRSDDYHLTKNFARCRPDLCDPVRIDASRPWWIRLHRLVAVPFRSCRRWLLVKLGIRTGTGSAASEHFAEDAVRAACRGE